MLKKLRKSQILSALLASVIVTLSFCIAVPSRSEALDGTTFNPENIISDGVFFNGQAMTALQIQEFLNSQVPHCLINDGTPQGHLSGEPYYGTIVASTCLKDFHYDTPSLPSQAGLCESYTGQPNQSAAQIIFDIGRICNISQKAILLILQKEQSLVTDDWPTVRQYDFATGFNCYDNGQPCQSGSAGFFQQVWSAARRLQEYGTGNTNWYPVGQPSQISYQDPRVDTSNSCGAATVTIRNRATAALYYYTPYVPNMAALRDLDGSGDRCSAYGNRNFWRDYWRWFGNPNGLEVNVVKALYTDILGRLPEGAGLAGWSNALSAGAPVLQVSDSILSSTEYRMRRIEAAYIGVLGRPSEPSGLANWLNAVARGIVRIDEVEISFMESDEYFNSTGGTNQTYVSAVYQRLLNRVAAQSEIDGWILQIRAIGRPAVTRAIFQSYESGQRRVAAMYRAFLAREPDASGLNGWTVSLLRLGDNSVRSSILGSREYWNRSGSRF